MATTNFDSARSIVVIVLLGVLSVAVLFVAPLLVGALVEQLGYSELEAGQVLSAELLGMSVSTLIAMLLASRVRWQRMIQVALVLMMFGNVFSSQVNHHESLLLLRFGIGLAAGVSMSTCIAMIARTANPDRTFALWVSGQLMFGAGGLYLLPAIFDQWGVGAFYLLVALLIALFLRLTPYLPERRVCSDEQQPALFCWGDPGQRLALLGVVAIFIYYLGQYGVWVYLQRLGVLASLPQQQIAKALSLAALIGITGALSAAAISIRFGRALPLAAAMIASLTAMWWLQQVETLSVYLRSAIVFSFTFNFMLPYLMASVASVDSTGRLVMLTNLASGAGLAAGPVLAGSLLQLGGSVMMLTVAMMISLFSLVMVIPLLQATGRVTAFSSNRN